MWETCLSCPGEAPEPSATADASRNSKNPALASARLYNRPRMLAPSCLRKNGRLALVGRDNSATTKPAPYRTGFGDWPHGRLHHVRRSHISCFRDRALWPTLDPLTAIPSDEGYVLPPEAVQIALRRRLRLALPLTSNTCGSSFRPCSGMPVHRAARTAGETCGARVAKSIGPEGQVLHQQWLTHTHYGHGRGAR